MEVLVVLAQNAGEVVSKDDLKSTVWSGVIITENVITRAISSLRRLLEDRASSPIYIETISKTGYRLVAKIRPQKSPSAGGFFILRLARKPTILVAGAIILLALGAFALQDALSPNAVQSQFHPLSIANALNSEYWPAISPDGRFAAFSWRGPHDRNWDIYARLIGTETVLQITDSRATELRARWSSDGNYIFFLRYEQGGATIYKKPVIGEQEIRVMRAPDSSFGEFDVSPDGQWISFNNRARASGSLGITLTSLSTGETTRLTSPPPNFNGDIHARFSPDGSKIGFVREKNAASMFLYVHDLKTGRTRQITHEPISINGFDWSKEGASLVYGADRSGQYKLWEVDLASGISSVIRAGDFQMVMPRVARTGRVIYAKMKDNVNLWSYKLDEKTASRWYGTNDLNLNPTVSPDGKKVCITQRKEDRFQLWTANIDGSGLIPITDFPGQYVTAPSWSEDGQHIVFQGFIDGQADLFLVNSLGGIPQNLTQSDWDEHTPHWRGNQIYFCSNQDETWKIWSMNPDGDGKRLLVPHESYGPQLSNDQKTMFYSKKHQTGLWKYDLSTGSEQLIIERFHPMYWGAFALSSRGIYYLNADEKRFDFFEFDTQKTNPIYQLQKRIPRIGNTLTYDQHGQRLLFGQIDTHDADIMLLEEEVALP